MKFSVLYLFTVCLFGFYFISCSNVEKPAWIEVTDRNLDSLLQVEGKLIIMDFSSGSDSLCQRADSIVFKIAGDFRDSVLVGRIEVSKYPKLAKKYDVNSVPAFKFVKNGKIEKVTVGVLQEEEIIYLITAIDRVKSSDSLSAGAGK